MAKITPTDRFDVAISVASADLAIGCEVARLLTRRGITAYLYTDAPGQTMGSGLHSALEQIYSTAPVVLFVLSANWSTTDTRAELAFAVTGRAADDGLWVLRTDDTSVPFELQSRVWWPRQKSLDELARALANRLGRRQLARWQEGVLAVIVAGGGAVLAGWLGFADVHRYLDWVAWVGAAIPAAWGSCFRLLPDLRLILVRARTKGIGVASPIERALDQWSGLTRWMSVAAMVVLTVYILSERRNVIETSQALDKAVQLVGGTYSNLRQSLNACSTKAAQVVVEPSGESVRLLEQSTGTVGQEIELLREAVRGTLVDGASVHASEVENSLDDIWRTLSTNIQYQGEILAEPGVSSTRRRIAAESLTRYNTLLAEFMNDLEGSVRSLECDAKEKQRAFRARWHGVLPG